MGFLPGPGRGGAGFRVGFYKPSYVNNVGLAVSSKSIEENCQLLQKLAEDLLLDSKQNCMQFDVDKTELIHFHSKRSFDLKNELYSVKVEETVFQSKKLVKYLDI